MIATNGTVLRVNNLKEASDRLKRCSKKGSESYRSSHIGILSHCTVLYFALVAGYQRWSKMRMNLSNKPLVFKISSLEAMLLTLAWPLVDRPGAPGEEDPV